MEKDSGVKMKEIRIDGGATANGFLVQFQADILGVPVVIQEVTETTAPMMIQNSSCRGGLHAHP